MPARTEVDRFMADARAVLQRGLCLEVLNEVGFLLAQRSREPGFIPSVELRTMHGTESTASVLQSDPDGLTLVLGVFSPKAETPVHDHGSWGIACVIQGVDRYRHWDRVAEGSNGERATLERRFERILRSGDVVCWEGPPDDIHSQQGVDVPAVELVLFGKNVMSMPRRYYDPRTGTVTSALPL
jgi:predicted metal-dependent enzyme (double-stranded beta helix superfamily)